MTLFLIITKHFGHTTTMCHLLHCKSYRPFFYFDFLCGQEILGPKLILTHTNHVMKSHVDGVAVGQIKAQKVVTTHK